MEKCSSGAVYFALETSYTAPKADGFLNVVFCSLVKATQPDVMLICDDYAVMLPYSSVAT